MSRIIVGNTLCSIKDEEDIKFLRLLDKELSFRVKGAEHTKAYKGYYRNGHFIKWDGIQRILTRDLTFPYGLLERVKEFYCKYNKKLEIDNRRSQKSEIKSLDIYDKLKEHNREPYPYQLDCLESVKENDCGIIRVATGGGKCTSVDSLHITEYGILSYSELIDNNQLKPEEAISLSVNVSTPLKKGGDVTSHIYRDGISDSLCIETSFGFKLTGTSNHKIKILSENGIIWKTLSDMKVGDYPVICPGTDMFGNYDGLTLQDAYWMGLLIGDGGYSRKNCVSFTNSDDHILNFARNYLSSNNIHYSEMLDDRSKSGKLFRLNICKAHRDLLKKYGFNEVRATAKSIPVPLRKLTKKRLAMVIRGMYETDGWIGHERSKPTICIALSSEKIIDQLHLILLNFGIVASRRVKKTTHADSHILTIYRRYIPIFIKEIGFDPTGRKFKKLNQIMLDMNDIAENCNNDIVPHQHIKIFKILNLIKKNNKCSLNIFFEKCNVKYNTISSWSGDKHWRNPSRKSLIYFCNFLYGKLKENSDGWIEDVYKLLNDIKYICSNNFYYDPIISISNRISDNYDFVVPETHSFVSQGFINHNTLIISLMTAYFGKSTIIYVVGKDLLHQMHKFFSLIFGDEVGIIGDGLCEIKDINIVSVWTVGQALGLKKSDIINDTADDEKALDTNKYADIRNLMKHVKVHMFDECHLAACNTIQEIYKNIRPEYIYGLSASPWRDDNADLLIESIFGSKIVDISASDLIDENYLVPPTIKFIKVPKYHESLPNKYPTVYRKYIIENDIRNNHIINGAQALVEQGYQTLVLYTRLKHGKYLYDEISKKIPCALLSGKDSSKTREEVKRQLEDNEISCIVASTIFDIGVDLPSLSGLINGGGGKSSVRALQRIGRVIRKFPSKRRAAVIDFLDQAKFLKNHSMERKKIYASERGFNVIWPK